MTSSTGSILIRDLAKLLTQNGIPIGQKRLFAWLRRKGYLFQRETRPIQRWVEQGLFRIKETAVTHADGHVTINRTTKVTGRGQTYFLRKYAGIDKQ